MKTIFTCILLFPFLMACSRPMAGPVPRPAESGEVLVYLEPIPRETGTPRWTLTRADAVREDGTLIPLGLHLAEVGGEPTERQRLLADGALPPGIYRGLAFSIGESRLLAEGGEAALLVPTEPVMVDLAFTVATRQAVLLSVAYRHAGSIEQQFRFSPVINAYQPERPVVTRAGYVTSPEEGHVTIFDRKTLQATGVIAPGERPAGVVLDERERRAYVAVSGENLVAVVDISSGEVIGRIQLQPGDNPEELALTPDGLLLITTNPGSDTASFLDTRSLVELGRVPVGDDPRNILLDRKGLRAFVFSVRSDAITVLDSGRREVVATISTEAGPWRGAFSRDGSSFYIIHRDSPFMAVLDGDSLAPRSRIQVGMGTTDILVDSRTDLIYIGRRGDSRVDIYDPFSLLPVDYLEAGGTPFDMTIDDEENRLLLVLDGSREIVAADLVNRRVVSRLEVGAAPHALAVMGARR